MATTADMPGGQRDAVNGEAAQKQGDEGFFRWIAIALAVVMVAGFSLQILAGRSSFDSPMRVHAHAVVFFGWIVIFLLQSLLATSGRIGLHRMLGWLSIGWMAAMMVTAWYVMVPKVQEGNAPFFFQPLHFLIFDLLSVACFIVLALVAIAFRKRTDWHRRLHLCAMALLTGPGWGRLLPVPLLIPYAFEAAFVMQFVFPAAGMIADWRRNGRVHAAWWWGTGFMVFSYVLTQAITYSPLGLAFYGWVTAGHPGAAVPPLAFPP
ncbi:MAG: hypothetical protein SF002_02215, partial [Alphaproteobacteria bacterium]|nr:hypothetical protein [Alphaproteobacteria bacterium]